MTTTDRPRTTGTSPARYCRSAAWTLLGTVVISLVSGHVYAGELERRQAKRIHDRLAGVPPTEEVVAAPARTVLDLMEEDILNSDTISAAYRAMDNRNFYDVTLKNFATPWTNRDQTVFAPLNDYTATIIGMVRDDVPFTQVLSADLVYIGDPALSGIPAYSMTNNDHYEALENQGIDLKQSLVPRAQSVMTDIPAAATAGIMTTRAAAEAFFIDGTNRAMFRFTLMNHLCTDLEPLKDNSRAPDRVRQDISRSPGGDSRIFMNSCVGCHSGMDPMAQAFAYYDFDETLGRLVYTQGSVQPKYLINADNFKQGYVTPDDHWDNYWRVGPNGYLGWSPAAPNGSGNGAKSLGQELAQSDAFARCQATKVFRTVCLRDPTQGELNPLVTTFTTEYKLKPVFAQAATQCMGN